MVLFSALRFRFFTMWKLLVIVLIGYWPKPLQKNILQSENMKRL